MPDIHLDVAPWDHGRQFLRNRWAVPRRYTPCRYPAGPVPVRVRLDWSVDGVEYRDARAMAWTRRLVLVEIVDRRLGINGVWLAAEDVRRWSGERHSTGDGRAGDVP